jgi:hypothetical protein
MQTDARERESPPKMNRLQIVESWTKILGAVAIPFVLAYFGSVISKEQRDADQREHQRAQLINLGTYLVDVEPRKHQFAAAIIELMTDDHIKIPAALVTMAAAVSNAQVEGVANASTGPSSPVANGPPVLPPPPPPLAETPLPPAIGAQPTQQIASALLQVRQTRDDFLKAQVAVTDALGGLVPRVFIHIADESARNPAQELRSALQRRQVSGDNIVAPGIERVNNAPSRIQLRYSHQKTDATEAEQLAKIISTLLPGSSVDPTYMSQVENDPKFKPRTYELWFPPGYVFPPSPPPS